MDLATAIDAYLDHLRVERGLSDNTISSYGTDLGKLAAHAESLGVRETEQLDSALVSRFLSTLARAGLGARSAARYLSSVRGLGRFLVRERALEVDPTELIDPPKIGRRLPKVLSFEEVERLLCAPNPATPRGLRDRAMLTLMYAAGLRVSELCGMRLGDLDRERGALAPLGKGGKRRLIPIADVALERVEQYLKDPKVTLTRRGETALFVSSWGGRSAARRFGKSSSGTRARRASPSRFHRTSFGTRLPPTCSSVAQTSAACRQCWGIRRSQLLRFTRMLPATTCARSTMRPTPGRDGATLSALGPMQTPAPAAQGHSKPPHGGRATAPRLTPPPVLASDVLRDELAPVEPARRASRLWDAGLAVGFAIVGVADGLGVGAPGGGALVISLCAGVIMAATALAPLKYLVRAVAGAAIGLLLMAIGLAGFGPLALLTGPTSSPGVEASRALAATVLPAALLFRSHYRAFRAGHVLLLGAFVLALPFAIHSGAVLFGQSVILARVGAALSLAAVLCSLLGLAETPATAATTWWSELLSASIALDVGLRYFYVEGPASAGPLAYPLTALALLLAASPTSLGLFQVLATRYTAAARRVDVHLPPEEEEPSPETRE